MSREDLLQSPGLEALGRMISGEIPPPSIAETMGLVLSEVEEGRAVFTARADHRHLNPLGMVHGGFAATALDSATGCAVHTLLEAGVGYATLDLDVKMLLPVPVEQELRAVAEVVHQSRRSAVAEGTLEDAEGRVLARGSAICMIFR